MRHRQFPRDIPDIYSEQGVVYDTEEEGLIAEEQGRFRKQRGCREQVLTLVLLEHTEMAKAAKGMLVAFIDFTKCLRHSRARCGGAWNSWV